MSRFWVFLFCFSVLVSQAFSAELDDQELLFLEVANIATGYPQVKFEAPSTVTVISEEEMTNMGARTLLDALRLVPGLEVGLDLSGMPIVSMRGLYTAGSEKILFMINGHPVNIVLTGGGTPFFADLSVTKIERVEIIRGPGSVLYGSNAFSGVINIILKKEVPTALSYRRGTYDVDEWAFQWSHQLGPAFSWLNASYREDSGARMRVKKDFLEVEPLASQNPGFPHYHKSNEWVRRGEYYAGSQISSLLFEGFYIHHADGGFFNLSGIPSKKTRFAREDFYLHLSWNKRLGPIESEWHFDSNYYHHHHFVDYFPPGITAADPSTGKIYTFQYGVKWLREAEIFSWGGEGRFSYQRHKHRLTWGLVIHNDNLHNPSLRENINPLTETNLPYMVNIPKNWIQSADRFYYSFYGQDEWKPFSWASLTLGARWDNYDDFGDKTTFRAGLVLSPWKHWRFKFLYGEAFRAPSFMELYFKKCPLTPRQGNPNLDAEEMESYEFNISYVTKYFQIGATFYRQNYYNLIYMVPDRYYTLTFENSNSVATTDGVEIESRLTWGPGNFNYLLLSYSYQDTDMPQRILNGSFVNPPYHLFSLDFNYRFLSKYGINYYLRYVGKRENIDSYILSNLVFNFYSPCCLFSLGIYNAFDKKYTLPSIDKQRYPEGFVRPGRTIEARLTWYF